jgi:uncharacterized protein
LRRTASLCIWRLFTTCLQSAISDRQNRTASGRPLAEAAAFFINPSAPHAFSSEEAFLARRVCHSAAPFPSFPPPTFLRLQKQRSRTAAVDGMPIASLILELRIEQAQSLKDRRQVVRSVKDKLRRGFNISVAELDEAVTWQSATIGVAAVSRSRDYLAGLMQQVENAATRIANDSGAVVADSWCSFLEEETEQRS